MIKKFSKSSIFALAASLFIFTLSSCTEEVILPEGPTVTISQGTTVTLLPGEQLTLNASAVANASLTKVEVFKNGGLVSTSSITLEILNFSFPVFKYTPVAAEQGTDITFKFVATDKNAKTGEASFVLKVGTIPAEKALAYEATGSVLGNKIGPATAKSAWSLVTNQRKAFDEDSDSDMQNPSIATGTVAQQWIKGWDGESETMFVKLANTYDYANATVEKITAAYVLGTPTKTVRDLVVGQIYVAKLRNKAAYAIIKITKVDNAVASGSSRIEEIQFSYKKELATTGN